jgi:hypothetical protein
MPVSKKRKSSGKRKRPKFTYTRREAGDERFGLRLKGSRLMYLKDDPDFHAVIRMGRLLNSIMFASQAMADYFGDESATGTRQTHRAFYVLCGYLHQGIQVVSWIRPRYIGEAAFEPLRLLTVGPDHAKARKIVRIVRNEVAFHQDEGREKTEEALGELKLGHYDLISNDDQTLLGFYFDFADIVDWQMIKAKLGDDRSIPELYTDLSSTVYRYSGLFGNACYDFLNHLSAMSKIGQCIEKRLVIKPAPRNITKERIRDLGEKVGGSE